MNHVALQVRHPFPCSGQQILSENVTLRAKEFKSQHMTLKLFLSLPSDGEAACSDVIIIKCRDGVPCREPGRELALESPPSLDTVCASGK